jgi:hypothetical protein
MSDNHIQQRWYWDHRNRKAYYPTELADGTVTFVSVWQEEEVSDALSTGALEPIGTSSGDFDDVFEFVDTFRTPESIEATAAPLGAGDEGAPESSRDARDDEVSD